MTECPTQDEVARWVRANFDPLPLDVSTLGLVEEVGELCRAIIKREQGVRGTYEEWTAEIRKELGDVLIKLLDVSETAGVDLLEATACRWAVVSSRNFRRDPRAHGLPAEDVPDAVDAPTCPHGQPGYCDTCGSGVLR